MIRKAPIIFFRQQQNGIFCAVQPPGQSLPNDRASTLMYSTFSRAPRTIQDYETCGR